MPGHDVVVGDQVDVMTQWWSSCAVRPVLSVLPAAGSLFVFTTLARRKILASTPAVFFECIIIIIIVGSAPDYDDMTV